MNPIELLFLAGVTLLFLFFALLFARIVIARLRFNAFIRRGQVPPTPDTPDRPHPRACLVRVGEDEMAMVGILVTLLVGHGLITDGVDGAVRSIIGVLLFLWLPPLASFAFWVMVKSDDGLAKACQTLLNWSTICLVLPLTSHL